MSAARRRSMSSSSRISSGARAASREPTQAPGRRGRPPQGSTSSSGDFSTVPSAGRHETALASVGPQFWRCKTSGTKLHCGPLGAEVAEVDAGVMVEESSHFYDYFGGLWVATAAGDDSMLWFNPRGCNEDGEPSWEFVAAPSSGSGGGVPPPAPTRGRQGGGHINAVNTTGGLGGGLTSSAVIDNTPRPSPPRPRSTTNNSLKYQFENFNNDAQLFADYYETQCNCQPLVVTSREEGGRRGQTEESSSSSSSVRDWNEEYQCLLEQLVFGGSNQNEERKVEEIRGDLEALAADFVDEVDTIVTTIVTEISTSNSKRTVPSYSCNNAQLGIYFRGGIFYRVCLDTAGGAYAGDANAQKVASTLHKTHELVGSYAPLHGLSCPLMVIMTFCGHRILASTIPPIQRAVDSVLVGPKGDQPPPAPPQGQGPPSSGVNQTQSQQPVAGNRVSYEVPVVRRMLDALGEQLNLKTHSVSGSISADGSSTTVTNSGQSTMADSSTTKFPAETTVHAGMDGRLYILNIGRTLPPLAPPPQQPSNSRAQASAPYFPSTTSLFRRLRPEATIALNTDCNPDAFVPGATTPCDNADVQRFTAWLRDDTIPVVAATLGFLEPLPSAIADGDEGEGPFSTGEEDEEERGRPLVRRCIGCNEEISGDTLRFLACYQGEEGEPTTDGEKGDCDTRNGDHAGASRICPGCFLCPQCVVNLHQEATSLENELMAAAAAEEEEEARGGGAGRQGEGDAANFQANTEEKGVPGGAAGGIPTPPTTPDEACTSASEAAADKLMGIRHRIAAMTKCCGGEPSKARGLKGLLMQPDVTTLFHSHGLNMRFLSYVHSAIPASAKSCTARYLEIEMIARAAKHLLNQALRRTQDDEDVRTVCVNFFLALLQPDGEVAEQFWSEQLGPTIQSHFEVFSAFDTSNLDMELCYRRVAELTGVELTESSVRSFRTDEPFVQLLRPHPVMKWMHLPRLTEGSQSALVGDGSGGGEKHNDAASASSPSPPLHPGVPLKSLYQDELVEFWTRRQRACKEEEGPVVWDASRLPPHMTT